MRENTIERRLRIKTESAGGRAWKWVSPGTLGVPDRIVLFPGGRAFFVETKAPGKKPDPIQEHRLGQLQALGFQTRVLDSLEAVDRFIEEATDGI